MKTIRLGVVGVGHLGYHHARIGGTTRGVELVGVVDTDEAARHKAATELGVQAFDALPALLDAGVDAVCVATPTGTHRDIACALLDAGVDVLVEKPIAATVEDGRAMVDAAVAAGRTLQVGHVERFNSAVIALFDVVKAPKFIECHRLAPYSTRSTDVSAVLDLMIHDLDIVRALVRSEVVSVDAVGVPVFGEHEDIANVRLRFASGCVANLTCSRVSLERMRKIRIFEKDAYVSTDYGAQQVMVYRKKPGSLADVDSPMDLIQVEPLAVESAEPLRLEIESFAACVRDGTEPVVSGEEGLAALELAFAVVESMRGMS